MKLDRATITISKLVHGGQGLGELEDGRKVFVWNALPGETVEARIIKEKRSYAEAIAETIIKPSSYRTLPKEANYLATSPWQMMTFAAENEFKHDIVTELFQHEKIQLPEFQGVVHDDREWQYRNKMEYSFWGDEDGLHLALHQRGSHGKQIVEGSVLAMPSIDRAASALCAQLNELHMRAGDLKTIIVRSNQKGDVVAALFTKQEQFPELMLPPEMKGLRVYHSNPKSPASVPTKLLHEQGDTTLTDTILGTVLSYDPVGFFQANVPVFEQAVKRIDFFTKGMPKVDFYSGVGSIGIPIGMTRALVEVDPLSVAMARQNVGQLPIEVIEATAETALEYVPSDATLIVDPPRAGLHSKVVERILEALPSQVCYLSCNPATHARDLALLQSAYKITNFEIYNFFPKTPHIETLAVLQVL